MQGVYVSICDYRLVQSLYRELRTISALDKSFVESFLKHALALWKPEIINIDQGGHFTNPGYIDLLGKAGVKISMDGRELRLMLNEYMKNYNIHIGLIHLEKVKPLFKSILEVSSTELFHIKKHGKEHNLFYKIRVLSSGGIINL